MAYVYYPGSGGVLPPNVDVAIKMASSVGTVMGQIGFGVMNDIYGRKKVSLFNLRLLNEDVRDGVDRHDYSDAGLNARNIRGINQCYRRHNLLAGDIRNRYRWRLPEFFSSGERVLDGEMERRNDGGDVCVTRFGFFLFGLCSLRLC